MKQRAVLNSGRWRYLAALLDMRLLLACWFAGILLAPLAGISVLPQLDRALFSLGAWLQREDVDTRRYVRVDIPHSEMQRLLHDPANARQAMAMLAQLQETFTRGVALVMHEPMWTDYGVLESVLNRSHLLNDGLPAATNSELAAMSQAMRTFQSMLANERILRVQVPPQSQVVRPAEAWLPVPFSRQASSMLYRPAGLSTGSMAFPRVPVHPLASAVLLERPLLWQGEQGTLPDARLALFQLQQQFRQPEWHPGGGVIRFADHQLRVSLTGTVLPLLSQSVGKAPALQRYTLDQLTGQDARRMLHEKTVVIGEAGDTVADDLLYSLVSLEAGLYAVNVPWFALAHVLVIAALLLYCLLIHYLPIRVSSVVSLLLLLAMLLAQQLLLLLHREWLPLGYWVAALMAGHLLMLLWCVRRSYYPLAEAGMAPTVLLPAAETPPGKAGGWLAGWWGQRARRPAASKIAPVFGGRRDDFDSDLEDTVLVDATAPLPRAAGGGAPPRAGAIRRQLGRYQLQRELGRGAMGVVYLGFDPKISRQVAIKTLHYDQFPPTDLPALKERFFREAEAAGRLRHPNIVTIYDAGEEADLAYIAMDYVSGTSLAAHVRQPELLGAEMVYWIMAQVADAVDYANSQGIVHRDIKPSNILFDEKTNEVKVADFGIARIMDGSATRTKTGDILGSPLYMSPEQLKGEPATGRSDIFSIGVTFYQLLTGELPFKGDSLANLSYQIVQGKFRPIEEVSPGLPDSARRIVNKALQKNPANRYASAGEMADAFQRAYEREFS
jgi:hypothetical protein